MYVMCLCCWPSITVYGCWLQYWWTKSKLFCWRSVSKLLSCSNSTIYSAIVVYACSRLPLKSTRMSTYLTCTMHVHDVNIFKVTLIGCLQGIGLRCQFQILELWNPFFKVCIFSSPKMLLLCTWTVKTHKKFQIFGPKRCCVNDPLERNSMEGYMCHVFFFYFVSGKEKKTF